MKKVVDFPVKAVYWWSRGDRATEKEKGKRKMEKEVEKIFNRQYERMKSELQDINIPKGYLTIVSKYWDFAKQDIKERIKENANQIHTSDIPTNG